MKRQIFILLASLVLLTSPVSARTDDILPVAQGRYSMAFALGDRTARPPVGSWVTFFGSIHRDFPQMLRVKEGFVLGVRDNVVFVEVGEEDAAYLATLQAKYPIRVRITRDADPEMVAERRGLAESSQPVTVAPRLRTVSVSTEISKDRIDAWQRGTLLTFRNAREGKRLTYRDDRVTSRYDDISAHFVSAVQIDDSRFEISVIVQPELALALSKASTEGRISIVAADDPKPNPVVVEDKRCYITHRYGNERVQVPIPCT